MSELAARQHGLEPFLASVSEVVGTAAGINIQIPRQPGQLTLRGNAGNRDFTAAVARLLGQGLPSNANTMTLAKHRVYWLGPNEWLLMTPYENTAALYTQLSETLPVQHAAVTNVSGGNILFRLAGDKVPEVLAKGCTLDLHPESFQVGMCAQSGLAKANVLIGRVDEQPTYEIIVRRSFSEYLARWLQSAAADYGVTYAAGENAVANEHTQQ